MNWTEPGHIGHLHAREGGFIGQRPKFSIK
jgi:hypothetical protein